MTFQANSSVQSVVRNLAQSREEFLTVASHELKTPLTPLKLQLQMLSSLVERGRLQQLAPGQTLKMLACAEQQVERLHQLVESLLEVTAIRSGQLVLEREELSLSDLVEDVARKFRESGETACTPIDLYTWDSGIGFWDRRRMRQVVFQLIRNALLYGHGKPVRVTLGSTPDSAVIVIQDQGIGIPKKDQERIFECFERAVSVTNYSGLGIGLFLSKSILEAHGGSVQVQSEVGVGSSFTVTLPITGSQKRYLAA